MFVALQLEQPAQTGLFGQLAGRFAPSGVLVEEASCLGAAYRLLRVSVARGRRLPWNKIRLAADSLADRILLPDDLEPPPHADLTPPRCPRFDRKVLLHTACELVRRSRMPMYRRVLGLWDPGGEFSDFLYPLLHHYTTVHVVTDNTELYRAAAADMMAQLGAPVFVGGDAASLAHCILILAPGSLPPYAASCGSAPWLATDSGGCPPGVSLISAPEPAVSPALAGQCPAGIAPHRFAAALHDHCGVELDSYAAHRVQLNYRRAKINEAVQILTKQAEAAVPSRKLQPIIP